MGEIKSTLDLVLEKTKNLTLSSEEKEEQKHQEIEKRIKGMLQKYQDGVLLKDQFGIEYMTLKKDFDLSDNTSLANELINRLDPHQNNHHLLEILQEYCKIDSAAIEAIIADYQIAYHQAAAENVERFKEYLASQYRISGSAVVPNLETDEQWRQKAQELLSGFTDRLNRDKADLLAEK
jgi:hypothetical protein